LLGFVGLAGFWLFLDVLEPAALFGPMCLIALSNGLVLPSATASAVSVRPELAGTASGLCGSLQLGIGALMSWLVGALVQDSTLPMVLAMTACGLVSLIGLAQVRAAVRATVPGK